MPSIRSGGGSIRQSVGGKQLSDASAKTALANLVKFKDKGINDIKILVEDQQSFDRATYPSQHFSDNSVTFHLSPTDQETVLTLTGKNQLVGRPLKLIDASEKHERLELYIETKLSEGVTIKGSPYKDRIKFSEAPSDNVTIVGGEGGDRIMLEGKTENLTLWYDSGRDSTPDPSKPRVADTFDEISGLNHSKHNRLRLPEEVHLVQNHDKVQIGNSHVNFDQYGKAALKFAPEDVFGRFKVLLNALDKVTQHQAGATSWWYHGHKGFYAGTWLVQSNGEPGFQYDGDNPDLLIQLYDLKLDRPMGYYDHMFTI